jgi:hypothetical protein
MSLSLSSQGTDNFGTITGAETPISKEAKEAGEL